MTNIIGWIPALVFVLAGGVKLIGAPAMVMEFAPIGIGQWFRVVTGPGVNICPPHAEGVNRNAGTS